MPNAAHSSMMEGLSAATTVRTAPLLSACCATRTTIGTPSMSAKGLLGSRVDARRAGMRTVKLIAACCCLRSQAKLRVGECAGFVLEEDGQAVAHRVSQPCAARDEFLFFAVVFQRPLGHGADEQFKQFGVHGS